MGRFLNYVYVYGKRHITLAGYKFAYNIVKLLDANTDILRIPIIE